MKNLEPQIDILHEERLQLGEGPAYDSFTDTAWWFDIVGNAMYEHRFASQVTLTHRLPFMASVVARIDSRRQLIAAENGLYERDILDGRLELVCALEAENPHTRSNDGRTHQSGALWIGTMGKSSEPEAGAIYWFNGKILRKLFASLTVPNAICFSPDGTIGYFADSHKGQIFRVAVDPATGMPEGEAEIFIDKQDGNGAPDGAIIDSNGNLWNARWGAAAIDCYAPAGNRIKSIAMPVTRPSCPVFAGADAENMVVTSAWEDMDESSRAKDPSAGKTFIIRNMFEGRFDSNFRYAA